MDRMSWIEEVKQAVITAGVVDAHHHMISPSQRKRRATGLIDFMAESYLASDLAAAGLDWSELADVADDKAWNVIAEFLPQSRFTSYYRVTEIAFRDLFDLKGCLWEADWRELDKKIKEVSQEQDSTIRILRDRIGMTYGLLDRQATGTSNYFLKNKLTDWYDFICRVRPNIPEQAILDNIVQRESFPPFSIPSVKIDALLWGYLPESHSELEILYNVPVPKIETITDYLAYVDQSLAKVKEENAVALKCAYAALRRIDYKAFSQEAANVVFGKAIENKTKNDVVNFENFIVYYLAQRCAELGLTFQFHTGTPFGGPRPVSDVRCDLMTDLVMACPDTRFVLMHGGFPYTRELADLAKRFSNVNVGLSWLPMISQAAAVQAIVEFVTMVPHNKIVWGNDAVFAEEAYGAFVIAVETVALAMDRLIQYGLLNRADALEIARCIFGYNAVEIFDLEKVVRE